MNNDIGSGAAVALAPGARSRFIIRRGASGLWTVDDEKQQIGGPFADLESTLAFAKARCGGGEATVELYIGEFYAVVQQELGWTKSICGANF